MDWSTYRSRRILRPPDSDMKRQFRNQSLLNAWVGIVVTVLSQFWIFTVWRAISTTSPSAPNFGISTQSPIRIMSLVAICMLATTERIVSLKTSMRTAVMAPKPPSSTSGDWPMAMATIRIEPSTYMKILKSCRNPRMGRSFAIASPS